MHQYRQVASQSPLLRILPLAQPRRPPLRNARMNHKLAPSRELIIGLGGRDIAANNRDLQLRHLGPGDFAIIHPRNPPMQIPSQIRLDLRLIARIHEPLLRLRVQCSCQRNRAGDDDPVGGGVSGGVGEGREDGVSADEVGFEGPAGWIGVEVAEEDVDEEGFVDGVFRHPDVRDPFFVDFGRGRGGQHAAGAGSLGGGGRRVGGDRGGDFRV